MPNFVCAYALFSQARYYGIHVFVSVNDHKLWYVTGFVKTNPNHTRTEIHFIA